MNRKDRANIIAQLLGTLPWKILEQWMNEQYEAHRASLENPKNPNDQFTKGQIAAYKDIFSFIKENETYAQESEN